MYSRNVTLEKLGTVDGTSIDSLTYQAIAAERLRAHLKHDNNGMSMERSEWYSPRWLPVLVEEVGEVARVLCDDGFECREKLEEELIQVAAMACAWIDACNDRPSEVSNPLHHVDGIDDSSLMG